MTECNICSKVIACSEETCHDNENEVVIYSI